jgi:hypothetical protein
MTKSIAFPAVLKSTLHQIAMQRNYPVILDILKRGSGDELIVNSGDEAQALVNIARIEMLDAGLKYPFWDEDSPNYDQAHEAAFQDVQMGIFEKTAMYLGQEFDLVTTV